MPDNFDRPGPQNLLRNTNPQARASIAASFGGPPVVNTDMSAQGPASGSTPSIDEKLAAMKRRMSSAGS